MSQDVDQYFADERQFQVVAGHVLAERWPQAEQAVRPLADRNRTVPSYRAVELLCRFMNTRDASERARFDAALEKCFVANPYDPWVARAHARTRAALGRKKQALRILADAATRTENPSLASALRKDSDRIATASTQDLSPFARAVSALQSTGDLSPTQKKKLKPFVLLGVTVAFTIAFHVWNNTVPPVATTEVAAPPPDYPENTTGYVNREGRPMSAYITTKDPVAQQIAKSELERYASQRGYELVEVRKRRFRFQKPEARASRTRRKKQ